VPPAVVLLAPNVRLYTRAKEDHDKIAESQRRMRDVIQNEKEKIK